MNAADYRRLLKAGLSGAYLFCGREEYMKRFCLSETRSNITEDRSLAVFNIIRFSGSDSDFSFGRIADALSSPPFFCRRKLTELHDLDFSSLGENDFLEFLHLISKMADSDDNILIIYTADGEFDAGTEKRRTKLYEQLSQSLTVVEFDNETPAKLAAWLGRHFLAEGIAAEPAQFHALIVRCGCAMYTLSGEAAKLCAYIHADGRRSLTDADIKLVTCANTEQEEFAFSNAVLDGDTGRAFRIMAEFKAKKEKPELILAGISSVLCGLKLIRVLSGAGLSTRDIAAKTKIHEYKVGLYQKCLRRRSDEELDMLLSLCGDTDLKIKSTGLDSYMLIDRMIAVIGIK